MKAIAKTQIKPKKDKYGFQAPKTYITYEEIVANFYVLEELKIKSLTVASNPSPATQRWIGELNQAYNTFTRNCASYLFDRLCLMSWAEARHARSKAEKYILDIVTDSRDEACKQAKEYNIPEMLPLLSELFNECDWAGSYGGKAWGKIVDACIKRKDMPDSVFIDHCMDLAHNNGLAYNKKSCGLCYEDSNICMYLLNTKRNHSILNSRYKLVLIPAVYDLLDKAVNLNIIRESICEYDEKFLLLANPITWGSKIVDELMEKPNDEDPDYDSDHDDHDDEEEEDDEYKD